MAWTLECRGARIHCRRQTSFVLAAAAAWLTLHLQASMILEAEAAGNVC